MQTTQVFIVNVAKAGLEPACNQLPFQQGISLSGYIAKKTEVCTHGLLGHFCFEIHYHMMSNYSIGIMLSRTYRIFF